METRRTITSKFGYRGNVCQGCSEYHNAIDFSAPIGTPVFSTMSGTISRANENAQNSCGKYLMIANGKYKITLCHLSELRAHGGASVGSGCNVALSGNTGVGTGPHLHYAVTRDGTPVDPVKFL
jgi:murein DD-endopeptidase MepM/ murein hydrolase activator NlpD